MITGAQLVAVPMKGPRSTMISGVALLGFLTIE